MKMANAPKKQQAPKYNTKVQKPNYGGYNINQMGSDYDNYAPSSYKDPYGEMGVQENYGYHNNYGGGNSINKPKSQLISKKPAPVRKGLGPLNPNFGGGGDLRGAQRQNFGGGFGGGVSGGDNRPIGGGMTADMMPDENEPTAPCPHCGRNFVLPTLQKHQKICQKVFQKKRKVFNMTKHRMVDSEQASLMKQGQLEAKKNPMLNKPKGGIPKWKLQSAEFRAICNPNKANQIKKSMGIPVGPSAKTMNLKGNNKGGYGSGGYGGYGGGMNDYDGYQQSVIANGYTHCQYCNRNYNEEAYNKHLNGCKRRYEEAQFRNKMNKKPSGKVNKPMTGGYGIGSNKYGSGKYGKKY